MKINKWVALMVFGVCVLGVSLYARHAGSQDALAGQERLKLLWPDLMAMPEADRALLGGLAYTCELHNVNIEREAVTDAVIGCIQGPLLSAPVVPRGMTKEQAATRLVELLATAEENKGALK